MKRRPVPWPVRCCNVPRVVTGVALALCGCPSERYSRPPGPAPRYEVAPLAPWHDATRSAGPGETAADELDGALAADAGPPLARPPDPEDQ